MTTSDRSPLDLVDPATPPAAVAAAAAEGPRALGPARPDLLRFGWCSAVLDAHPDLLAAWAGSEDRPVRRAVMRSPHLGDDVAAQVVATRRSGMHTLGSNPAVPRGLLDHNPGARRRHDVLAALAPGGLGQVDHEPNDPALLAVGSPTVDLVLARSARFAESSAVTLAGRDGPPVDPWVGALLVARFGAVVGSVLGRHLSRPRLAAIAALAPAAELQATPDRPRR